MSVASAAGSAGDNDSDGRPAPWRGSGSKPQNPEPTSSAAVPPQEPKDQTKEKNKKEKTEKKKGNIIGKIFSAIFATRQLADKGDRKAYIQYTIRELCFYAVYLTVLCLLTFSMTSPTTYYYTKVMYDLFIDEPLSNGNFKSFRTSTNINDFWAFAANVLPDGLHWEPLRSANSPHKQAKNEDSLDIMFENRVMGVARFRQIRVKHSECLVANTYHNLNRNCTLPYDKANEDTGNEEGMWEEDFLRKKFCPNLTENALKYQTEADLGGSSHWGKLAQYSGAGAVQILGRAKATTNDIVNCLKTNGWIWRQTRVVFLDFTVYNANINLFCVVRLVWEFPATGGLITSWSLRTVRLISYLTFFERYVIFTCEIIFICFTVYYVIQEIVEIIHLGFKEYVKDIWSWLDVSILIISGLCIGFSIYRQILVDETLEQLTIKEDKFHDFEFLGYWQTQFNYAASVCVFFAWVKVFKYISFNKTMTQLSSTLSRCAKDIGGFAIMFFIVFFAFAQLGYLLFGSQVRDFSTFEDSIFTLLRLILGDFNFRQIEAANRVLGPIFFLGYVFFVFFVLLNMFLAIINDTYSEVKAEIQAQRNEFEIADYIKSGLNSVRGIFGKRNAKIDAETAVKLAAADGQITYDELRDNLKSANFTDVEIEMFLARYELDQDRALDEEETQQVLADLEGKRIALDKDKALDNSKRPVGFGASEYEANKDADLYQEEFADMQRRVDTMEASLSNLIAKLEEILVSVEINRPGPDVEPGAAFHDDRKNVSLTNNDVDNKVDDYND